MTALSPMSHSSWGVSERGQRGKSMKENNIFTPIGWIDPEEAPDLSTPEWQAKINAAPVQRVRPKGANRGRKVSVICSHHHVVVVAL
jgi:hypothetical protein